MKISVAPHSTTTLVAAPPPHHPTVMEDLPAQFRIYLAFMDRNQDLKFNSERHPSTPSLCTPNGVWERLVGKYNSWQRYIHCEVAFPLDQAADVRRRGNPSRRLLKLKSKGKARQVNVLAFASFKHVGVVMVERPFSNKAYGFYTLRVSRHEFEAALRFAKKCVGKPYDDGASARIVCWPPESTGAAWWCASLTHAILQRAGFLCQYRVNTLDVDDIVTIMEDHERSIEGVLLPVEVRAGGMAAHRMFHSQTSRSGRARAIGASAASSCDATLAAADPEFAEDDE